MKRSVVLSLIAVAALVLSPIAWNLLAKDVVADGEVEINETNIPDANFRAYMRDLQKLSEDDVSAPAEPANVETVLVSATRVNVSWDAVSDVDGYQVSRATSADGPYTALGSVTATNRVCVGLTAGTTYYFKVRAFTVVDEKRIYGPFGTPVSVSLVQPDAPSGVKADLASGTSAKVSWDAVSDADGYQVSRATSADGPYTALGSVTTTNRVCTGLTAGTTYYFKVRAYRVIDGIRIYGPFSASVSVTTIKLNAPTDGKAKWIYGEVATVSWSDVPEASGYQVWSATDKDGPYKAVGSVTTTNRRSIGLKCGSTYYFKVRAYKIVNGTRIYGPYSSVITLKGISPTSELKAVSYSATSIKLSWNKVDGVDGYAVWRSTEKRTYMDRSYLVDSKVIGCVTTTERICPGLTSGTEYYFQVSSYIIREDGSKLFGPRSSIVSAVPTPDFPLPSTPSGVKAEYLSESSIKVSWNAVDGVDGYQVWRAETKYDNLAALDFVALGSVTTTDRVCPGLKIYNGFNYYFKVRAYKVVDGKRAYSAFSSAVTLSDLPAPTDVKAVVNSDTIANGRGYATISWSKVNGATGYEVRLKNWANVYVSLGTLTETSIGRWCAVNTDYEFKVRAYKEVKGKKVYSAFSARVCVCIREKYYDEDWRCAPGDFLEE